MDLGRRACNPSRAMRYPLLQRYGFKRHTVGLNSWYRSFHGAKARVTTLDRKGLPISYEAGIRVGEPHQAYIYVDPEVGNAIKSSIVQQIRKGQTENLDRLSLDFNHKSNRFAHKTLLYPRVDIPQDLPRQTGSNISPATLWFSGNWHAITLDGTPDESFERASRDSASELKGALKKLKDH
ncbi:hypothetical protein F5Y10DRAFT_243460 [Nemania abortiva]|nr:hypothetical protein F5Y10DRAFT_243460 [Nemania abortiva]